MHGCFDTGTYLSVLSNHPRTCSIAGFLVGVKWFVYLSLACDLCVFFYEPHLDDIMTKSAFYNRCYWRLVDDMHIYIISLSSDCLQSAINGLMYNFRVLLLSLVCIFTDLQFMHTDHSKIQRLDVWCMHIWRGWEILP